MNFAADASLEALAHRWNGRIAYVAGDIEDRVGLSAVLVRPDGIVAWATESIPDEAEIAEVAARWFGEI